MPVLAICYGMQALNVARGGTLVQDIESQAKGSLKHEQGAPHTRSSHGLKVAEQIGNRLAHGTCWSDVRVERREDGSKNARKEFDAARVRNVASR